MKAPGPDAYPYLEEALQGFNQRRRMVKAAGDSLAVLGFVGLMQEFYRFVNRLRLAALPESPKCEECPGHVLNLRG